MAKSSFTVIIRGFSPKIIVITGVTSIMPNLDGFLFQTEDRHGVQIEKDQCEGISGVSFDYDYTDEDFEEMKRLPNHVVYDHREK